MTTLSRYLILFGVTWFLLLLWAVGIVLAVVYLTILLCYAIVRAYKTIVRDFKE